MFKTLVKAGATAYGDTGLAGKTEQWKMEQNVTLYTSNLVQKLSERQTYFRILEKVNYTLTCRRFMDDSVSVLFRFVLIAHTNVGKSIGNNFMSHMSTTT